MTELVLRENGHSIVSIPNPPPSFQYGCNTLGLGNGYRVLQAEISTNEGRTVSHSIKVNVQN